MSTITTTAEKIHARQLAYCTEKAAAGDLIDGSLFVESMRKLGYRNVARAADELIDNSIEAGAENIHLVFGYDNEKDNKPSAIAFVDDGYGMIPEMISAACRWGGTDRHGSRTGFGRFGFGLPSASVSQGRRFEVLSRIDGGSFFTVAIDVDAIVKGEYTGPDGRVSAPKAGKAQLPDWILEDVEENFPGGVEKVRTVIVWDNLDFKQWRTTTDLERNLVQRFGVTYRSFLRSSSIKVNGRAVEAIDPLFITPGNRYYEPLPDGAEPLPSARIPVKDEDTGKGLGEITVRYAYMHPEFLDGARGRKGESAAKARFSIRKENNGLIFTRNGRQVDVVNRSDVYTFQNNSKYAGVEIDFPATMDDLFGITTSKQSVELSDRVITLLQQNKVNIAIRSMENRYRDEAKALQHKDLEGDEDGARASEKVMEELSTVLRKKQPTEEQELEAKKNLDKEIERAAKDAGVTPDVIAEEKERETLERPYKIEFEKMVEGPFYRVEQRGAQLVIILNTSHRFYTDVYAPLQGLEGVRVRAGLELLLFVLGQCETEAMLDGRIWYQSERVDWSRKLNATLLKLNDVIGDIDEQAMDLDSV